ncbi:DNA-directed RNA polymerase sigma-70 factor [Agaricicola taiwanensis]|uniref:DNA-directed RNA polymerase sigma-70 factor n=1 Tax=Agaricicola taiwanensis TaxID=591372 RepID=A0A8J2VIU0_9RHOB|nr:sigma-70 family RNA polymerase sigma factor [Agaricicola taiwanensis]GGE27578.1 DNA-directed RNA polymerase sigma-70 factor [Agaricicola taiwanensis]
MVSAPDHNRIAADAALMARIAAGDQAAFGRVMRDETPRLVRLALSLLGSAAEAEEVAQDAFLRLWNAAPDWEPRAQIGTWLHQVSYRLSIDIIRRRRPTVDVEDMEQVLSDDAASPERIALDNERDRLLAHAMDRLPPRQRTAIVLAHLQGLSQAEASAVLDVTEDAYESLLARARRRLKELTMDAMGEKSPAKDG